MATATSRPPVTPEALLSLPDAVRYELVDGNLVRRNMGSESSLIALQIAYILGTFLRIYRLGLLFGSDSSYQCFADAPKKVRRADVGFVRFDRLPGGKAPKSHCRVAPDLAIEVVSPNDTAEEVDEKVVEWLDAGVLLVWVVSPGTRKVRVHRPRPAALGPISLLTEDETIGGEDVLPGFSCLVREFFENI